jgi:hypothetical protein
MKTCPTVLDGAVVVFFARIDHRQRFTKATAQRVNGAVLSPAAGFPICQYHDDSAFYVFHCDSDWNVVADTWHESQENARRQAEFEYAGVSATWETTS